MFPLACAGALLVVVDHPLTITGVVTFCVSLGIAVDDTIHVLLRTRQAVRRKDGSYVKFDGDALCLVDGEGNPRGTRIFGAVARELREKNFMKIVSLAQEVV